MRISGKSVFCVFALGLLAAVVPALAAEVTRDSYREAVEPICKANTKANERILRDVRKEVKQGKLKAAASHFERAAKELRKTVRELRVVPQPADDKARLTKWLRLVGEEASYFQAAGKQLRAGNKVAAQRTVLRLTHNANQANNLVIGFEFRYCRLEPSKFT